MNNRTHTETSRDKNNHWLVSIKSDNAGGLTYVPQDGMNILPISSCCLFEFCNIMVVILYSSDRALINYCTRLPDKLNSMSKIDEPHLLSDTQGPFNKICIGSMAYIQVRSKNGHLPPLWSLMLKYMQRQYRMSPSISTPGKNKIQRI